MPHHPLSPDTTTTGATTRATARATTDATARASAEATSGAKRSIPLTRRGFLVRTGAAGAFVAASGALAGCQRLVDAASSPAAASTAAGYQPRHLPFAEYATLVAVARRLVPSGEAHPGADVLGVAARIDRELGFHGPSMRSDVRDALRLVEWWPLFTRFARFTSLSPEAQDAELEDMIGSRFSIRRSAFGGLKFFVMFFHYSQDAAWAGTGYDGPWVPRARPAQSA